MPNVCPNPNVRLYAKLEFMNPTGSVKDRVAKYLMEDLEASGRLQPDSIIIEPTSGNTGIGLAMIARRKGYRVAVVVPDNVTMERRQLLALFGAEVIDSPGHLGSNGAVALAKHLVAEGRPLRHALPVRQRGQSAGPRGDHRPRRSSPTAPRSTPSWPASGTGGTLMGVGRRLRRHNPDVRIYAAEPLPGEQVQGLRSLDEGFIPEIFDPTVIDGKFLVSNTDAIEALRELTEKEGIFAGVSCGAVMVAAKQLAREMERGTIVALLADGGWKYLSEDIWSRDLDADEDEIDSLNLW